MEKKRITIGTGRIGRFKHPAFQRTVDIRYCGENGPTITLSHVFDFPGHVTETAAISYPHPGNSFQMGSGPRTFEIEDVRNMEVITLKAHAADQNEIDLELIEVKNA